VTVDRRPARLSRGLALAAGLVAVATSGAYAPGAIGVGALGLLVLAAGFVRGRDAAVTLGAAGVFAGAVVAGVRGAPAVPVLVAVTASVVAWDAGGTAMDVGRQLGRAADTRRLEAVHAGASLAVGAVTAGVGYAVFRTATGGQPAAALLFALLAAALLVVALD
jgi:hypothetical protein